MWGISTGQQGLFSYSILSVEFPCRVCRVVSWSPGLVYSVFLVRCILYFFSWASAFFFFLSLLVLLKQFLKGNISWGIIFILNRTLVYSSLEQVDLNKCCRNTFSSCDQQTECQNDSDDKIMLLFMTLYHAGSLNLGNFQVSTCCFLLPPPPEPGITCNSKI